MAIRTRCNQLKVTIFPPSFLLLANIFLVRSEKHDFNSPELQNTAGALSVLGVEISKHTSIVIVFYWALCLQCRKLALNCHIPYLTVRLHKLNRSRTTSQSCRRTHIILYSTYVKSFHALVETAAPPVGQLTNRKKKEEIEMTIFSLHRPNSDDTFSFLCAALIPPYQTHTQTYTVGSQSPRRKGVNGIVFFPKWNCISEE